MILRIAMVDARGASQGECHLKLDFGAKQWSVPAPAERVGKADALAMLPNDDRSGKIWSSIGFSRQGIFELRDNGVIWIWDQEPGKGKRNTLIIWDAPANETDTTRSSGNAIGFEPRDLSLKGVLFPWKSPYLPCRALRIASGDAGAIAQAESEKDDGDAFIKYASVSAFFDTLDTYSSRNARFSEMVIYSHGSPGQIVFERSGALGLETIESYGYKVGPGLLAAGASVRVFGCVVAAQPKGERFLAEFAKWLLQNNGGTVVAYSGIVETSDYTYVRVDNTASLPKVTARVRPGGMVTLEGAKYLDPKIVQTRLEKALKWLQTEQSNPKPRWPVHLNLPLEIQNVSGTLSLAKQDPFSSNPFRGMENDWYQIRSTEGFIRRVAPEYDPGVGPK